MSAEDVALVAYTGAVFAAALAFWGWVGWTWLKFEWRHSRGRASCTF